MDDTNELQLLNPEEQERLKVLRHYRILDTPPNPSFDRITELAAHLLNAPIACINLVDAYRIWSKSKFGTSIDEYVRLPGFCSTVIESDDPYLITDAAIDPRTKHHPIVDLPEGVRFYIGIPLHAKSNYKIGTLCVIDFKPRAISNHEIEYLQTLARIAVDELELHLSAIDNQELHDNLAVSEYYFRSVFEQAGVGVAMAHPLTGEFTRVNQKYCDIVGYSQEELLTMDFLSLTYADDIELQKQANRALYDGSITHYQIEKRYIRKDKTIVWVDLTCRALWQPGETQNSYIALVQDITEKKLAELTLQASEERWKFALEGSNQGVWDLDLCTNQIYLSTRCMEMLGYEPDQISSSMDEWIKLIHPEDVPCLVSARESALNGTARFFENEHRKLAHDGSWRWIQVKGMVVSRSDDGTPLRVIGTYTDIHDKKCAQAEALRLAQFDSLTNLPNRSLFLNRLDAEIKRANKNAKSLALLMIDLDRFKEINDTLGHPQGDQLIQQAASRLLSCMREVDTVARLGGDEFMVILTDLENSDCKAGIEVTLKQILSSLAAPYSLKGRLVYSTASIGICYYPDDAVEVEALLRNADQAMYNAKNAGRNRYSFFTVEMQLSAQAKLQLTSDLRQAINRNELEVYYQPIVDLQKLSLHKAEALLRWKHPTKGCISPATFIPLAEETGLITELGNWVFYQTLSAIQLLQKQIAADFQVSINKSPVQFKADNDSHAEWIDAMTKEKIAGNSLVIEITEGILMENTPNLISQFQAFKNTGIQIALDDFGTGYSSLSYLKNYKIDYLKIDQSFVRNLTLGSPDLALCEAMIAMAHKLGIKVIAEGVETELQLQLLQTADCDYAQGYLFSKPIPLNEFISYARQTNL